MLAKRVVLYLARKYRQAAFYMYRVEGGVLLREVIWCDPNKQDEHGSVSRMEVLHVAPSNAIALRREG